MITNRYQITWLTLVRRFVPSLHEFHVFSNRPKNSSEGFAKSRRQKGGFFSKSVKYITLFVRCVITISSTITLPFVQNTVAIVATELVCSARQIWTVTLVGGILAVTVTITHPATADTTAKATPKF